MFAVDRTVSAADQCTSHEVAAEHCQDRKPSRPGMRGTRRSRKLKEHVKETCMVTVKVLRRLEVVAELQHLAVLELGDSSPRELLARQLGLCRLPRGPTATGMTLRQC